MTSLEYTADSLYKEISDKIISVRNKESVYRFVKNLLMSFSFFAGLFLLLLCLEAIFNFSSQIRKFIYFGYISLFVISIIFFTYNLLKNIFSEKNVVKYSLKIGKNYNDIKDRLSNSLFLYENNLNTSYSNELIFQNLLVTNNSIKNRDISSFLNFNFFKSSVYILISVLFINFISFLFFPSQLNGAFFRYQNFNYSFVNNLYGISFDVNPGNIEILKGTGQEIEIKVNTIQQNVLFDELKLFVYDKTKEGTEILKDEIVITSAGNNFFKTTLNEINNDLVYYAELEEVKSQKYKISVSDYPVVKKLFVTIKYPELYNLPDKKLSENEGNANIPEGSTLYFYIESNKNLKDAGINFNNNYYSFEINSNTATGQLKPDVSGKYSFKLTDVDGSQGKNYNEYDILVSENKPPVVIITQPQESNYSLKNENDILLRARISDDLGFMNLKLNYRLVSGNSSASAKFNSINIPVINLNATSVEVPYLWDLRNIKPGKNQKIEYYFEVTDNSGKTGKSEIKSLSYFSAAELLKATEKLTKELKADLKSIFENVQNLSQQSLQSKNYNKTNEELGLNDPNKQNEIKDKVENLQQTLNETQNKIEQSLDEMKKNNMLNDQTLEQYMKMQELFNKINTPELQEMLKKIQDALKKKNPDELRDAMKNFNFDEEMFKKNMEKILDIMKKIENLQKIGELTQKLDEIKNSQEELKKETEQSNNNDNNKLSELSEKQKDIKQNTDNFKNDLQDLIDKMNEMKQKGDDDMDPQKFKDLLNKMNNKKTSDKMNKSSEQMKSDKEQSEQTQEDIMNDLNEMNEDMQNALENMLNSQSQTNKMMDKLKDIKSNLENLSKKQNDLIDKTKELTPDDKNNFSKNKQEQNNLQQDLSKNIDDLMNMSKEGMNITPELGKELGNSYNKMENSKQNLDKSNKQDAIGNQGKAKESLDKSANMLSDMISKMEQEGKSGKSGKDGKSGKGNMEQLMEQLANMIAQQQGLAGQMGQFGQQQKQGENGKEGKDGTGKDGNMSQEQKDQVDKLRMEQQQLAKSLEQLSKEFEEEQKKTGEKLLGNLDEIKKQMEEVVKQMSDYKIDDKLIEKQNKILSRMLDAQLSQREKDFEQKRESKPGENITRNSPPEIVLSGPNSFNALKEEFLKLQKSGFNEDYEILIAKYLTLLRQSGNISN